MLKWKLHFTFHKIDNETLSFTFVLVEKTSLSWRYLGLPNATNAMERLYCINKGSFLFTFDRPVFSVEHLRYLGLPNATNAMERLYWWAALLHQQGLLPFHIRPSRIFGGTFKVSRIAQCYKCNGAAILMSGFIASTRAPSFSHSTLPYFRWNI